MTEGTNIQNTEYLDGFQYTQEVLDFFPHQEGYVKVVSAQGVGGSSSFNYVFTYTDHLGNIRLRYTKTETQGLAILEEDHYYPFGLKHNGYNSDHKIFEFNDGTNTVVLTPVTPSRKETYKYKFGGIELQEEFGLNLYSMDFRQYDPAIGRFTSIDPVSHYHQSSYASYNNNPIYFSDPSGASDKIGDWLLDLFQNTPNDGMVYRYDSGGTQTGVQTPEEYQQEQEKKTKAKGGAISGEYLEDNVGHKHSGGFFFPKETKGKKLSDSDLFDEIKNAVASLEELQRIISYGSKSGMGVSGIAYLIKKRTPAGLGLSSFSYIASLDIPEDQKELLRVAMRYFEMHKNDKSDMQGVYRVYRKSGNMLIPGSDKVTLDYYDASTGEHLGGIKQGAFGF